MVDYHSDTTLLQAGIGSPPPESFAHLIPNWAPNIPVLSTQANLDELRTVLGDGTGDHEGIGPWRESEGEWFAKNGLPEHADREAELRAYIIDSAYLAATTLPWDDPVTLDAIKKDIDWISKVSLNYSHRARLWKLAAYLTTNATERTAIVKAARDAFRTAQIDAGNLATPNTNYYINQQTRACAWAFRDTVDLAEMEDDGLITDSETVDDVPNMQYRTALQNYIDHLYDQMNKPFIQKTGLLFTEIHREMDGRDLPQNWNCSPWQQAMGGMALHAGFKAGYTNILPLMQFHFDTYFVQKLEKWGWSLVDTDYFWLDEVKDIFDALTLAEQADYDVYGNVRPEDRVAYDSNPGRVNSARYDAIRAAQWPKHKILDASVGGVGQTWKDRMDMILTMLGCYVDAGVVGAEAILREGIAQRHSRLRRNGTGDNDEYKYSLYWREYDYPAWRRDLTDRTINLIPNSMFRSVDPSNNPLVNPNYPGPGPWEEANDFTYLTKAWNGGCRSPGKFNAMGSGHTNGGDNAWYYCDLWLDTPQCVMPQPPSGALPDAITLNDGPVQEATGVHADGRIRAPHTFNSLEDIPGWGLTIGMLGGVYISGSRYPSTQLMVRFDPETYTEIAKSSTNTFSGSGSSGGAGCYDKKRNRYWWRDRASGRMHYCDAEGNWHEMTTYLNMPANDAPNFHYVALTMLPDDDLILITAGNNVDSTTQTNTAYLWDPNDDTYTPITFTGAMVGTYVSGDCQPRLVGRALYIWNNHSDFDQVNKIALPPNLKTDPWPISQLVLDPSNTIMPSAKEGNGTWGRWQWHPDLNGFALMNSVDELLFFFAVEDL